MPTLTRRTRRRSRRSPAGRTQPSIERLYGYRARRPAARSRRPRASKRSARRRRLRRAAAADRRARARRRRATSRPTSTAAAHATARLRPPRTSRRRRTRRARRSSAKRRRRRSSIPAGPPRCCRAASCCSTDAAGRSEAAISAPTCDPVLLEIFNNQFAAIAEQMGITLRNTSSSVNVKERLDFSCALFTPTGDLVVNAPHIPVHLGAMGETVRAGPRRQSRRCGPATSFVTNDPYRGGSHLPDVTVVTPVHDAATGELLFFTASRAHHAEIGGIRARLDAAVLEEPGRRRRADSQLQAGRRRHVRGSTNSQRCSASGPYPVAQRRPTTWPTSPRRWPPTSKGPAICCGSSSATRGRSSRPTCGTFATPPSGRCGRRWRALPDGRLRVHRSSRRRHADHGRDHDRRRLGRRSTSPAPGPVSRAT